MAPVKDGLVGEGMERVVRLWWGIYRKEVGGVGDVGGQESRLWGHEWLGLRVSEGRKKEVRIFYMFFY